MRSFTKYIFYGWPEFQDVVYTCTYIWRYKQFSLSTVLPKKRFSLNTVSPKFLWGMSPSMGASREIYTRKVIFVNRLVKEEKNCPNPSPSPNIQFRNSMIVGKEHPERDGILCHVYTIIWHHSAQSTQESVCCLTGSQECWVPCSFLLVPSTAAIFYLTELRVVSTPGVRV